MRNEVLETWDTHGLTPGLYTLKLTVFLTAVDSLEALRAVYLGEATVTSISGDQNKRVTTFSLSQNYPNPFNPETTIQYQLPQTGNVTLSIFNLLGQEVRTLVHEHQTAGSYSIVWDGKNDIGELVTSGMYFYKLQVGESFLVTRKMLLLK